MALETQFILKWWSRVNFVIPFAQTGRSPSVYGVVGAGVYDY